MIDLTDIPSLAVLQAWANLKQPARFDVPGVAKFFNFAEHDIPILVAEGKLRPLGSPAPNAPKYFSSFEIFQLAADRAWLDKATRTIADYWKKRRERTGNSFPKKQEKVVKLPVIATGSTTNKITAN